MLVLREPTIRGLVALDQVNESGRSAIESRGDRSGDVGCFIKLGAVQSYREHADVKTGDLSRSDSKGEGVSYS